MGEQSDTSRNDITLYRPIWADPGFILSTNDVQVSDHPGVGAPVGIIAPANPKRWAIGFIASASVSIGWRVGPWNDPTSFGVKLSSGDDIKWYTLFTHGPLVCREWYGSPDNSSTIRVIEIETG